MHLVGCLHNCTSDARSRKHQVHQYQSSVFGRSRVRISLSLLRSFFFFVAFVISSKRKLVLCYRPLSLHTTCLPIAYFHACDPTVLYSVRLTSDYVHVHLDTIKCFDVLLTVHLSITLVNDQLDAQLLYFIIRLLQFSTCFEQLVLIIRMSNCINTASGMVTVCKWPYQMLY